MRIKLFALFICMSFSYVLIGQETTSTVRGKIVDKVSQMPLIGVVVVIGEMNLNGQTDINGNFVIKDVPTGRQIVKTQYLGYEPWVSEDLIISSSKETYLDIGLIEQVEVTETIVVAASKGSDGVGNKALNDLSVVSTRSFSVEETKRYAANADDPGRMAAALPGISIDSDAENDVIIRGNSAFGVLWRLEGLEVPNPSHFARPASTAGGITVFSAAVLGNTDVSTGAFAAEYGNALSGVFDMRNRKGNMEKREHSVKIGLIGLGASTEGPIKKGTSSYLVNFRYSTLGLFNAMGFHVIRENVGNAFGDLSFNLTFNSKDNRDEFKVFGVGGMSNEVWTTKSDTSQWVYLIDYADENNGSNLGIVGFTYRRLLNDQSYLRVAAGSVLNHNYFLRKIPQITNTTIKDTTIDFDYKTLRSQLHLTYSNKLNRRFRIKTGASLQAITYWLRYMQDKVHYLDNLHGNTFLVQGYAMGSYKPVQQLTINVGVHAQLLTLNASYSIEPRISLQYKPFKKTTISAAYGIHSKALGIGSYLLQIQDSTGSISQPNKGLEMPKAHHAVLAFQQVIGLGFRLNLEGYYQYGFHLPTGTSPQSGYMLFNDLDNYGTRKMVAEGQSQNYGVDMTIEKAFSRRFFVLATGALFWSQYKSLGDTQWRRSRVDRRWSTALMGGYEFDLKKGMSLQINLKTLLNGGVRLTPADRAASIAAGKLVRDNNRYFEEAAGLYFRLDGRIAFRHNTKKFSYTIALDVQNATNMKNVYYTEYDRQQHKMVPRYQSGILPVLSFQIDF